MHLRVECSSDVLCTSSSISSNLVMIVVHCNCYHAVDLLKTLVRTLLVFTGLYCVCMSGVVGFVVKA